MCFNNLNRKHQEFVEISNESNNSKQLRIKLCNTFGSKLKGLMIQKNLSEDEGIILVNKKGSKVDASIHMMFMNFDLTVLWVDKDLVVVDKVLAKKGVKFYFPKVPAQYVIEVHQNLYHNFSIGDKLMISQFL